LEISVPKIVVNGQSSSIYRRRHSHMFFETQYRIHCCNIADNYVELVLDVHPNIKQIEHKVGRWPVSVDESATLWLLVCCR